jgi:hypothetical protein
MEQETRVFPWAEHSILYLIAGNIKSQTKPTLVGKPFRFENFPWSDFPGEKVLSPDAAFAAFEKLIEKYPAIKLSSETLAQIEEQLVIPADRWWISTVKKKNKAEKGKDWMSGYLPFTKTEMKDYEDRRRKFRMVALSEEHSPLGEVPDIPEETETNESQEIILSRNSPQQDAWTVLELIDLETSDHYVNLVEKWPEKKLPHSNSHEFYPAIDEPGLYDKGYESIAWSLDESLKEYDESCHAVLPRFH